MGWIFCSIIHQMSCQKVFFSLINLEFSGRFLLISKFPLHILLNHTSLLTCNLSVLFPSKSCQAHNSKLNLISGGYCELKDQENKPTPFLSPLSPEEVQVLLAIFTAANKSCSWDNLFLSLITLLGFGVLYLPLQVPSILPVFTRGCTLLISLSHQVSAGVSIQLYQNTCPGEI